MSGREKAKQAAIPLLSSYVLEASRGKRGGTLSMLAQQPPPEPSNSSSYSIAKVTSITASMMDVAETRGEVVTTSHMHRCVVHVK